MRSGSPEQPTRPRTHRTRSAPAERSHAIQVLAHPRIGDPLTLSRGQRFDTSQRPVPGQSGHPGPALRQVSSCYLSDPQHGVVRNALVEGDVLTPGYPSSYLTGRTGYGKRRWSTSSCYALSQS